MFSLVYSNYALLELVYTLPCQQAEMVGLTAQLSEVSTELQCLKEQHVSMEEENSQLKHQLQVCDC